MYEQIGRSGLFDPATYLSLNHDVRDAGEDPWWHFLRHGFEEGRHFTTSESVAPALAWAKREFPSARHEFQKAALIAEQETVRHAAEFRRRRARIGVYCSEAGNFYMQEIADLLDLGFKSLGIDSVRRSEASAHEEKFDLRIFVAPHEFFYLGTGKSWLQFVGLPNSALYNVEQVQTQWFCKAFPLLLKAPLVLDINLQNSQILQKLGCRAVFFMPGHMENSAYTRTNSPIRDVNLVKAYRFAKDEYDWRDRDQLTDRPIDVLFVGARTPHRDRSLVRLDDISEICRFVCVYREASKPFTLTDPNSGAAERNWALSQRSKIVLNLHRDWLGFFEWSRMVLRGFWQGACVVTDPCLPNPVFQEGVHYLEESPRHLRELIRWLLLTDEGTAKLDATRRAGYERARTLGSMETALAPVLAALSNLLARDRQVPEAL